MTAVTANNPNIVCLHILVYVKFVGAWVGVKRCSKLWIMLVFRLLLDLTCSHRNISETPFVKGAVDDWRLFSRDGLFLELFAAWFGAKLLFCRVLHFQCLKASRAGPTSPSITTGCLQRGPSEQHTLGTFSTLLAIIPYEAEVLTLLIVNCLCCDEQLFTIKLKKSPATAQSHAMSQMEDQLKTVVAPLQYVVLHVLETLQ